MNMYCLNCKSKTEINNIINRLNTIYSLIKHLDPINDDNYNIFNYNYDIHLTCKIGINGCNTIRSAKIDIKNIINKLNPYLIAVAKNENETLYYRVLNLLKGYFPSAYTNVKKLHYKYQKDSTC